MVSYSSTITMMHGPVHIRSIAVYLSFRYAKLKVVKCIMPWYVQFIDMVAKLGSSQYGQCSLGVPENWLLRIRYWVNNHHHHVPPWIRSFGLFRHRRIAIVSWGVHGLFFLEVCSWGRVSGVWGRPFFQGGWTSFVCIWVSRLVFQKSLVLSLCLRFLFYPVLCIP